MNTIGWDEYFMRHVYLVASKSKDTKTQIGSVLVRDRRVISSGYNGIPAGVRDDITDRYERPTKYSFFEHSERNAIFGCARFGVSSDGTTLYTNGIPCSDCGRAIIQSGIVKVVIHKQWNDFFYSTRQEKWGASHNATLQMFSEAGIIVEEFDMNLGISILIDGQQVKI